MASVIKRRVPVYINDAIAPDIYNMWIEAEDIAETAKAGQFVSLYCNNGLNLLPRPISICEIDRQNGRLRLVYRIAGKGTKEFASLKPNDTIEVMGPSGNGFMIKDSKALIIGGGIGIPPMLELSKRIKGEKSIVLGYRDFIFLEKEFETYGKVYISTEDGSAGTKGNVLDAIRSHKITADIIYACGPMPMLKGIKAFAVEQGIKAQLSLEERMACGVGACLGCVCKSKDIDHHSNVNNMRICKDGPVFYADQIDI